MNDIDLGSLVISLRATRVQSIRQHMGRTVQRLCLDILRRADPALSAHMHEMNQTKPYAVSGLLCVGSTQPVRDDIAPGAGAWVRLVGMRAEVVAALDKFAQRPPATVNVDREPWEVEHLTWTDHAWAGRSSYRQLATRAQNTAPHDAIWLEFASPTAFSSADLNIPLPDPMRIFDSLRQQWIGLNTLPAPFALPDTLMEFVRHFVPLTEYSAHTELARLRTPEIGFCADRVKFTIKSRVNVGSSLRKNKPDNARELDMFNEQRDDLARAVALLADFAFYCGVGIKTTTGMGMSRHM